MQGDVRLFPPAIARAIRAAHREFQAVLNAALVLTECDVIRGARVLEDFSGVVVPKPEEPKE